MTTVERIPGRWRVSIDGEVYLMNRFGVVWQESPAEHFPGWTEMNSVPSATSEAVRKAVTDAGYAHDWNRGEPVWQAKRIVGV
jgi:hypothetical protein